MGFDDEKGTARVHHFYWTFVHLFFDWNGERVCDRDDAKFWITIDFFKKTVLDIKQLKIERMILYTLVRSYSVWLCGTHVINIYMLYRCFICFETHQRLNSFCKNGKARSLQYQTQVWMMDVLMPIFCPFRHLFNRKYSYANRAKEYIERQLTFIFYAWCVQMNWTHMINIHFSWKTVKKMDNNN